MSAGAGEKLYALRGGMRSNDAPLGESVRASAAMCTVAPGARRAALARGGGAPRAGEDVVEHALVLREVRGAASGGAPAC